MNLARRQFVLSGIAAAAARARGAPSRSLRTALAGHFQQLRIADSHEHFWDESRRLADPFDFFALASDYAASDVTSAGMSPEDANVVRDPTAPLAARWEKWQPYWNSARFTGYSRAVRMALRDLYHAREISLATLPKINGALAESNRPGVTERLIGKLNVSFCVQDDYWHVQPVRPQSPSYILARRVDRFIVPSSRQDVEALEQLTGLSIATLRDLKRALAKNLADNRAVGMTVLKIGLAYMRELQFAETSEEDAERDFEALMQGNRALPEGFRRSIDRPFRRLEDHMFHEAMRLVEAERVPVQIHTGILAGNRAVIGNTRPGLLTNVFLLYPRIRFDLFHMSFPYQDELLALGKSFPNVHVDFCWAHVISPAVARRTLAAALDIVPANKIFAFGGDYHYPELSYAHGLIARRNVAEVLADFVESGGCSETEAAEIGRIILHDGAAAFFGVADGARKG
jgi:uncharacterized protein